MRSNFYVYEHIKADTKEIFYVGKGCGKRARTKSYRNKYWHNIVNKHGFEVRFLAKNVDEEFAFLIEQERIDQLKRIGVKICNLTDGGEGSSGLVMPESAKQTISAIHKGKTISEEQRTKTSEFMKKVERTPEWVEKVAAAKRKPVMCCETGVIYKSNSEAEEKTGINRVSIKNVCNGWNKTAGGYKWRFVK